MVYRYIRKYLPILSLLGISSLIMLFITDIFIQRWYPIPGKEYFAIVSMPPGSILTLMSAPDNFEAIHRYNRFGCRGPDFSMEPTTDIRIACIGDSFTEGIGAQEEETWPMVLSHELSDLNQEVLNLGDAGAGPADYARVVAHTALPLKPTDMIVCFISNDFSDNFNVPEDLGPRTEFKNLFLEQRRLLVRPIALLFPGWVFLLEHTFRKRWEIPRKGMYWRPVGEYLTETKLVNEVKEREGVSVQEAKKLIQERRDAMDPNVVKASQDGQFRASFVWVEMKEPGSYIYGKKRVEDMNTSVDKLSEAVRKWLVWYQQTCQEFGIRPWILYFPQPPLVSNVPYGIWPDHHPVHIKRFDVFGDTSLRDLLKTHCTQLNIAFLDATGTLKEHNTEKLFWRYDTHPTARAYGLVGKMVADQMRSVLTRSDFGDEVGLIGDRNIFAELRK